MKRRDPRILLTALLALALLPSRAGAEDFDTMVTLRGQAGVGSGDFHEGTAAGAGFGVVAQYGLHLFDTDVAIRLTADRTFLGVESTSLDDPVRDRTIDTDGDFTSTRIGLHLVLPAGSFQTVAIETLQPYLQLGAGAAVRDFCLTTTVRDLETGDATVDESCDDRTQFQATVAFGFLIRVTERIGLDLAAGMDIAFEEGLWQLQASDAKYAPSPLFTVSLGVGYRF